MDHHLVANPSPNHPQYRGLSPNIDPILQHNHAIHANSPHQMRMPTSAQDPSTLHASSVRSLQASPRAPQSQISGSSLGRTANSMSPPLDTTPRSRQLSADVPTPVEQRQLPSPAVTDATIDDAYVQFILYSNPAVPHSVDTAELRKTFRSPPRSDGKLFNIHTLWELIRKLENKELKTWTQLAIDLGVEPPSADKGQSAQKVQQYAVRLKRWMHAMHVDAFFEYLLNKPHSYYTQLSLSMGKSPEQARDGVPLEEDLALRALVPEWKPKRGRKKAEDKDPGHGREQGPAKRPHLDTINTANAPVDYDGFGGHSALFPQSAIPWSAFPDDPDQQDPWAMASAMTAGQNGQNSNLIPHPFQGRGGQDFRWRMSARDGSPAAPYPQSAVTPRHRALEPNTQPEPQSAVTPSSSGGKSKSRRRHGPAVSSAWPSNGNASNGKLRGRPPTNRSVQDGPFSTFPANPNISGTPSSAFHKSTDMPSFTLKASATPPPHIESLPPNEEMAKNSLPPAWQGPYFQKSVSRPSKLQLQVPQHSGGPVRLATPPTVLVNGETDEPLSPPFGGRGRRTSADFFHEEKEEDGERAAVLGRTQRDFIKLEFSLTDVIRAFAARLLQGKLSGRLGHLSVDEANLLAEKALTKVRPWTAEATSAASYLVRCAILLGVGQAVGLGGVAPSSITIKTTSKNSSGTPRSRKPPANGSSSSELEYTILYDLDPGTDISTTVQIRNISLPSHVKPDYTDKDLQFLRDQLRQSNSRHSDDQDADDDAELDVGAEMPDATWKQRFISLRKEMRMKEANLQRNKRRILEAVFAEC